MQLQNLGALFVCLTSFFEYEIEIASDVMVVTLLFDDAGEFMGIQIE
jgi:hypothetical protein